MSNETRPRRLTRDKHGVVMDPRTHRPAIGYADANADLTEQLPSVRPDGDPASTYDAGIVVTDDSTNEDAQLVAATIEVRHPETGETVRCTPKVYRVVLGPHGYEAVHPHDGDIGLPDVAAAAVFRSRRGADEAKAMVEAALQAQAKLRRNEVEVQARRESELAAQATRDADRARDRAAEIRVEVEQDQAQRDVTARTAGQAAQAARRRARQAQAESTE